MDVDRDSFSADFQKLYTEPEDREFDLICLSFVLMHLYDGEKLLRTLKNFLKKGGVIFITESNDRISTLAPDEKNLLGQFLDILKEDKYAGKRETGQAVPGWLTNCGRDMHVGDTIIGIKGRVGFEAAAPMLIIGAHKFLEKYTLSKWQQYWKDQVANWYGMFLHESQYLEPVMRDIEAMLESSQRNVNGTAILELHPLCFSTVGVESKDDLVKNKFGEYGEMQKGWTAEDAKGFIKVTSTALRAYYSNHKDEKI